MPISHWIVTGGSGFLGSEVCNQLSKANLCVINFDKVKPRHSESWKTIEGEISNPDMAIREYKDLEFGVIHAAGLKSVSDSILNPELFEKNNYDDSVIFFKKITQFNCKKFIFVSSAAVYGDQAEMVSEETQCHPVSRYWKTKKNFEDYLMKNQDLKSLEISIVRPFNIVGRNYSNMTSGSVITKILESLIMSETFNLNFSTEVDELGNRREPIRDYIDVADVAGLILNLSVSPAASLEIFNAANGVGSDLSELIRISERITKGEVKKNMGHLGDGEILYSVGNNSKSINRANWLPRVSLLKSIENEYQSLLQLRNKIN